jgi:hypothetical protein
MNIETIEKEIERIRGKKARLKKFHEEELWRGVYFLFKEKTLVYIGQSVSIPSRILSHKKDKDFDEVWFYAFNGDIEAMEEKMIEAFRPSLNSQLTGRSIYNKDSASNSLFKRYQEARLRKAQKSICEALIAYGASVEDAISRSSKFYPSFKLSNI